MTVSLVVKLVCLAFYKQFIAVMILDWHITLIKVRGESLLFLH